MARGPFQGTYQSSARPTIVTAPDAIVYINGETDLTGCPTCHRKFDLGQYITSIQVDLSIESAPGSASISLSIPRHTVDDFYFDGVPIICPMMEVEIFAKGYFTVEGLPQYYPIFWGIVTEVGTSYSSGEHTVSIHCADILKWWEICKMNINPAFTQAAGQMGTSIFQNVYYGTNPYDIIWSLAQQCCGDVLVGSGSLMSMVKEGEQKQTFTNANADIMRYWESRFSKMRSNLLLYGAQGTAVRGDAIWARYCQGNRGKGPFASNIVRTANGGDSGSQMVFDPTDPAVCAFRTQFSQAGQVNFWQSEFQTKLELANSAKNAIGFEFYMDVTGDIVFKPPFYNLDIMSNKPISWIQDIDIIDYDLSESEAEVVTQVVLQGSFGGNVDYGFPEECTPCTTVTDYHLLRKYGWRQQTFNSEFLGDPMLMFYTGLDMLDRYNSKRHRGTVTIPCRPELRLGFPIYLAPFDQIWYIQGISHNIAFGGRATTTLTLTARRQKFIAPKVIANLKLASYGATGPNAGKGKGKGAPAKGGNQPGGTGGAQPTPPAQAANSKVGYSSRQLAANANFEVRCGGAVTLPAAPVPDSGKDTKAYEPLVLRHPKSGRILGYPNVTMVYSRPFSEPVSIATNQQGQKTKQPSRKNNLYTEANLKKTLQTATKEITANIKSHAKDKYATNRYQYGLNSAGVYVYAYDQSKVIQEILLLPSGRLKSVDDTPSPFQGKTGMIRPVSDERGFELVGHWRYGRGVALRDGSLVLDQSEKGGNNKAANIGVQLALTGDLTATLNAQSNGLTSIITKYPNPADAMARLMPDDLASAAVVNPDTGNPEIISAGTNFVDAAPLGSVEQKGTMPNVEASQLSRALTLAEMSVRESQILGESATQCSCMLGRADLTFINTGYTVQTLIGTAADNSSLPKPTMVLPKNGEAYLKALDANQPISPSLLPQSRQDLIDKVNSFLWNLYSILDTPHQAYEEAIRGGNIAQSPEDQDPEKWRFSEPVSPYDNLAPPFNGPNRAVLGDPASAASAIVSNAQGLSTTINTLGQNLRDKSERTLLTQRIAKEQSDLARAQGQLASLQKIKDSKEFYSGDLQRDIDAVTKHISEISQQLAKDQQDLNDLDRKK